MKIIIDAMSGDKAPEEIVKGAVMARRELGVDVVLVGRQDLGTVRHHHLLAMTSHSIHRASHLLAQSMQYQRRIQ